MATIDATIAVRGTHRVLVLGSATFPAPALDRAAWTLDYDDADLARIYGPPPTVMRVTAPEDGQALVETDCALLPDVAYDLSVTFSAGGYTGLTGQPVSFTGVRTSRPARPQAEAALLDIDAPLIRPGGAGGDYRIGASGDRALAGGKATVERAIWHAVFKDASPLRWKALRPLRLQEEERRLARIVAAIPYVQQAHVQITFGDDHALVVIRARTDFGDVDTTRAVP